VRRDYSRAQRRTLELLREAGRRPVAIADLLAAGITQPASVIYELELTGHPIEHVFEHTPGCRRRFVGYRLREPARNSNTNSRERSSG
jgi:hypothetical protein